MLLHSIQLQLSLIVFWHNEFQSWHQNQEELSPETGKKKSILK